MQPAAPRLPRGRRLHQSTDPHRRHHSGRYRHDAHHLLPQGARAGAGAMVSLWNVQQLRRQLSGEIARRYACDIGDDGRASDSEAGSGRPDGAHDCLAGAAPVGESDGHGCLRAAPGSRSTICTACRRTSSNTCSARSRSSRSMCARPAPRPSGLRVER